MSDTGRRNWPSRNGLWGPTLLICLAGACASAPPPPPPVVEKPPELPVRMVRPSRLAWMPLDGSDTAVARALNDGMSRAKPEGTVSSTKAGVSMEVAQLAIECIQATPECYAAVARSLNADRVMWAQVVPAEQKIRVTVLLFDAGAGTTSKRTRTYDGAQAARAGVAELVEHAAGGSRTP